MTRPRPAWPAQRLGDAIEEATMLARLARDLPGFLRTPLRPDQVESRIRHGLDTRQASFLDVVDRAIYRHPGSPYLRLLRHVGCEAGDLTRLVDHEGIEGALRCLAEQGVYITFDEFKGRREVVRGSARFAFSDRDFDSPLVTSHYPAFTGGTRGRPGRVLRPLDHVEELATSIGASIMAHGLVNPETAYWLTNPITSMLFNMKLGHPAVLWIHPLRFFPRRARIVAHYFKLLGALAGTHFPRPRLLMAERADRLARWLGRRAQGARPIVMNTIPSSAVRVTVAAGDAGVSLQGVTFYLQSEPVTPARRRHIVDSGAQLISTYTSMEMPAVGVSCATPESADDYHLATDRFALVERERPVVEGGPTILAMLLTTLTDTAPKIALNTELGDYARVDERACGCLLGSLGLTTHLSEARSFEKLSGEGVTFVRSNLIQILEEVLPVRFGGSAVDYQLIEEEAPDSSTRLVLRVNPSVGEADEESLRSTLLAELGRGGIVDQHHAELLRRANSVTVRREPALASPAGKVLPFQLLPRTRNAAREGSGTRT